MNCHVWEFSLAPATLFTVAWLPRRAELPGEPGDGHQAAGSSSSSGLSPPTGGGTSQVPRPRASQQARWAYEVMLPVTLAGGLVRGSQQVSEAGEGGEYVREPLECPQHPLGAGGAP